MTQKQFKIGLSNADKQNMAQAVYERVLALTFNEYDTTTEYEVGDFVVYNDQLYKCISATSGAWDSSKWQLATLNDLVADIENAVAFVNDKANVDGNYPTMTVGMADNLTPYDESAGDDQDEPFSLQATGTGNGTQPDFATGSAALMKEKQGNTVCVNQQAKALNTTNWNGSNATVSFADGVATFTATAQYGKLSSVSNTFYMINGHKYLAVVEHKGTIGSFNVYFSSGQYISNLITDSASAFTLVAKVFEYSQATGNATLHFQDNRTSDWTEQQIKNLIIVDLTQWFGSNDNIPAHLLAHPEDFFRYYQGSLAYNTGELVNANGRYIKCTGMNQWDEEWEKGSYGGSGEKVTNNNSIRCKNQVRVIPGQTYYIKSPKDIYIWGYDANGNYVDRVPSAGGYHDRTITIPEGINFIAFKVDDTYGTTYNHDISINLYYEDEPCCLTYEPYQVLTNNDTGTEVLRSAGSAKDSKAPDGTITRRIKVGDLSNASVIVEEYYSSYTGFACFKFSKFADAKDYGKYRQYAICDKYLIKEFAISDVNYICGNAQQNHYVIILPTGTTLEQATTIVRSLSIFYELDEPTTEQGTPYSENLVIDDFGSMDFGGTNGVPQGALIFYPVDYKAFVDTLYKYTDGTPSDIALKSDVSSEQSARESVDTQLKNALGGTLRQCLCVKESLDFDNTAFVDLGELTWNYNSNEQRFYCFSGLNMASIGAGDLGKIICTKYKTYTYFQTVNGNNKIGYYTDEQNRNVIAIKDTTYNDATAFKNAMKGVLLAYEKASE